MTTNPRRRTRRAFTTLIAVLAATMLAGCSSPNLGDDGDAPDAPTAGADAGPTRAGDGELPETPSPGAAAEDLPVLGTREIDAKGDGRKVTLEVNELKVRDGFARLVFTITNTAGDGEPWAANDLWPGGNEVQDVELIDNKNAQRYLMAETSSGVCICSHASLGYQIGDGQSMVFFTTFKAPPPAVDKIDVVFSETMPISDVPVTR